MARRCLTMAIMAMATFAGQALAQVTQAPGEISVKLIAADFSPEDGKSYDPKWPGPPRRAWTEADKKTYSLTAKLSAPAQEDFSVAFLVRENKTWDFDPVIASVIVQFARGDTVAQGTFWLVCNREGRIQGNLGRDFDGYGNLYLKANALVTDPLLDTWKFVISAPTITHQVHCR